VIVNERTGVIVMGGDVRLRPGAIAQGGLTVTIAETAETSQPGPLSNGETTTNPRTDLQVVEENKALVMIPQAVTLTEVVDVLNVLGTTPRDLISILQAMSQGGMLVAEIRRM
jgi:flagellar P-ring protein FlgI